MIYGLILIVHLLVCLVLIGVILLQGGRGGLSEAMGGAAAQSLFGGGAATVLTKATAVCASLFVVTCLSLAYLSTQRGRSVIERMPAATTGAPAIPGLPVPQEQESEPSEPAATEPTEPAEPASPAASGAPAESAQ